MTDPDPDPDPEMNINMYTGYRQANQSAGQRCEDGRVCQRNLKPFTTANTDRERGKYRDRDRDVKMHKRDWRHWLLTLAVDSLSSNEGHSPVVAW